jgi:hypothetical protein
MKSALLAAVLLGSTSAFADGSPCRLPLRATSEAVPAVSRTNFSELDVQARCLKWEYNLPQKAEFLPPTTQPPRQVRTRKTLPPLVHPGPPATNAEFHWGGAPLGMTKSWLTLPGGPPVLR